MSRISGIGNGVPTVWSAARSDTTNKPLDAPVGRFIHKFISHPVARSAFFVSVGSSGAESSHFRTCPLYPFFCFLRTYLLVCRRLYNPRDPPTRKRQHRER